MENKVYYTMLGDSISLGYTKFVDKYLPDNFEHTKKSGDKEAFINLDLPRGSNCGDSGRMLSYIKDYYESGVLDKDFYTINCGLHDIKRSRETGLLQIPLDAYIQNLHNILDLMQSQNIPIVFINSTPSATERYSKVRSFYRLTEDIPVYNKAAEQVMTARKIPVIDLYAFTCALGLTGDDLFRDHTHFQPEVIRLQAAYLAGCLGTIMTQEELA